MSNQNSFQVLNIPAGTYNENVALFAEGHYFYPLDGNLYGLQVAFNAPSNPPLPIGLNFANYIPGKFTRFYLFGTSTAAARVAVSDCPITDLFQPTFPNPQPVDAVIELGGPVVSDPIFPGDVVRVAGWDADVAHVQSFQLRQSTNLGSSGSHNSLIVGSRRGSLQSPFDNQVNENYDEFPPDSIDCPIAVGGGPIQVYDYNNALPVPFALGAGSGIWISSHGNVRNVLVNAGWREMDLYLSISAVAAGGSLALQAVPMSGPQGVAWADAGFDILSATGGLPVGQFSYSVQDGQVQFVSSTAAPSGLAVQRLPLGNWGAFLYNSGTAAVTIARLRLQWRT